MTRGLLTIAAVTLLGLVASASARAEPALTKAELSATMQQAQAAGTVDSIEAVTGRSGGCRRGVRSRRARTGRTVSVSSTGVGAARSSRDARTVQLASMSVAPGVCWARESVTPPSREDRDVESPIPPLRRFTLKVMGRSRVKTVSVRADGTGLSSRAGTALLPLVAVRLGLTDGLSDALAGTRERRSGHDPGRVFCDLAVMLADGGRCISDLAALAGQASLFGEIASVSTARRVLLSVGEAELAGIRAAERAARARAWVAGAAPDRVILDFDATPVESHSEKERAAGHYKGGFGLTRCWSRAVVRCLPGSCARGTLARTTLPITSKCSSWRSRSYPSRRWTGRSWRARTPRAPVMSSRSRAARRTSGSRSDTRSRRPRVKRSSRSPKQRGCGRSTRTVSSATEHG